MWELITIKQLREILKVNRITIYRMLNDGRIKGFKVGRQWRIKKSEVDRLLGRKVKEDNNTECQEESFKVFPKNCILKIEKIFAGVVGIGVNLVSLNGESLTEPIYSNPFCELMLLNPRSRKSCEASWRSITSQDAKNQTFQICHAGLCYQREVVSIDGHQVAWLIAGQFRIITPDIKTEETQLTNQADRFDIPLNQLREAASKIPTLKRYQWKQVQEWTPQVSNTITSILCKRSDLLNRLHLISDISSVNKS